MTDPRNILLKHVSETLPESPVKRLELLSAMWAIIGADHPAFQLLGEIIQNIQRSQQLQKELPLKFTEVK